MLASDTNTLCLASAKLQKYTNKLEIGAAAASYKPFFICHAWPYPLCVGS